MTDRNLNPRVCISHAPPELKIIVSSLGGYPQNSSSSGSNGTKKLKQEGMSRKRPGSKDFAVTVSCNVSQPILQSIFIFKPNESIRLNICRSMQKLLSRYIRGKETTRQKNRERERIVIMKILLKFA